MSTHDEYPAPASFAIAPLAFEGEPCAHAIFDQAINAVGVIDMLESRPMNTLMIPVSIFEQADERLPNIVNISHHADGIGFGSSITENTDTDAISAVMKEIENTALELGHKAVTEHAHLGKNVAIELGQMIGDTNINSGHIQLTFTILSLLLYCYGISVDDFLNHLKTNHTADIDTLMNDIDAYLNDH